MLFRKHLPALAETLPDLPTRTSRRLGREYGLNESQQVLHAPVPLLLVDAAHRMLLEVL
jgi:hypothetical protein